MASEVQGNGSAMARRRDSWGEGGGPAAIARGEVSEASRSKEQDRRRHRQEPEAAWKQQVRERHAKVPCQAVFF